MADPTSIQLAPVAAPGTPKRRGILSPAAVPTMPDGSPMPFLPNFANNGPTIVHGGAAPSSTLPANPFDNIQMPQLNLGTLPDEASAYRFQHALLSPNPFDVQMAQQRALQAGSQAGLGEITPPDPSQIRFTGGPAYTPAPYSPQQFPMHNLPQIPDRPAPQNDLASGLMSGIAGAFDPVGAGHYAAAPLQAAHEYAAQAYQDALRRFQMATEQANTQYGDQAANVQLGNQAQLYNVGQGNQAQLTNQGRALAGNEAYGAAQAGYRNARLPFLTQGAESGSLIPQLGGLAQSQAGANMAGAGLEDVSARIAAAVKAHEDALKFQEAMFGPQARYFNYLGQSQARANQTEAYKERTTAEFPVGRWSQHTGFGGGRPLTENEAHVMARWYNNNPEVPVPESENPRVKELVDPERNTRPLDPSEQGKYTFDEFDERVKVPYKAWQQISTANAKLTQDQRAVFDKDIWSNTSSPVLQSLQKQYDAENIKGTTGENFHSWAQTRWLSVLNPAISDAAARETEARRKLDDAVKKLGGPSTPGAAMRTNSGSAAGAGLPSSTPKPVPSGKVPMFNSSGQRIN